MRVNLFGNLRIGLNGKAVHGQHKRPAVARGKPHPACSIRIGGYPDTDPKRASRHLDDSTLPPY